MGVKNVQKRTLVNKLIFNFFQFKDEADGFTSIGLIKAVFDGISKFAN